jgi:hypothetical protein
MPFLAGRSRILCYGFEAFKRVHLWAKGQGCADGGDRSLIAAILASNMLAKGEPDDFRMSESLLEH